MNPDSALTELLAVPTGAERDPLELLGPLGDALSGTGPAVAPVLDSATGAPVPDAARSPLPASFRLDEVLPEDVPESLRSHTPALVVSTSGSTGTPKQTVLSAEALAASASATAQRLGFDGQWLLALPVHYVAGAQLLVRSLFAGTTPVADPSLTGASFSAAGFAEAVAAMNPGSAKLTSLVPTQLERLLSDESSAGSQARRALAQFDAILLGGAPASKALRNRWVAEGLRVITTYGSSETAGGCVYDGQPLPGISVRLDSSQPGPSRIALGGPTIALGYLGQPQLTAETFLPTGSGLEYLTSDTGSVGTAPDGTGTRGTGTRGTGTVAVHGRVDDVVITGGVKVSASYVRGVIEEIPGVRAAFVGGVPDPQWGQRLGAVVASDATGRELEQACRERLQGAQLPKVVVGVPELPLLPHGKEDRQTMLRMLAEAH